MTLQALIFDVDGTLAETEEVHRRAFNETFAAVALTRRWPDYARGWIWDQTTYRRLLKTTGGKERIAHYLREDLGLEPEQFSIAIADLHRAKTTRYVELIESGDIALREGVRRLVEEARARGIRLAIATTTSRPNVEVLCRACFGADAAAVFEVIAAGDDVARKKPAADVYDLALARLGLEAEACVALEDSRNGLLSAKSAGLFCVVAPSIYTTDEDHHEADLVIAGFDSLDLDWLCSRFERASDGGAR